MTIVDQLNNHYTHAGVLLTPDIFMGMPMNLQYGAQFDSRLALGFNPTACLGENVSAELSRYTLSMNVNEESEPFFFIDMRVDGLKPKRTIEEMFAVLASIDDANTLSQEVLKKVYFFTIHKNQDVVERLKMDDLFSVETTKQSPVRFYFGPRQFEFVYDETDRDCYELKDDNKIGQYELLVKTYTANAVVYDFKQDMDMHLIPWVANA